MFSRYRSSSEKDEQQSDEERFRKVHRGASIAKGRCIPIILYDRSILGRNAVRGVSRVLKHQREQFMGISNVTSTAAASSQQNTSTLEPMAEITSFDQKMACQMESASPASRKSVIDFPPNETQMPSRSHLNSSPCNITNEIRNYGELYSVTKFHTSYLLGGSQGTASAVSTISVAFSSDGDALASTHGDHTVKITCCHSGRLLRTLQGHPRTPWTVKFHPSNKYVVASGCLGFQVRVWNWSLRMGQCLNVIRLQYAIISLAFHPSGGLLAVASGNSLYLWDFDNQQQKMEIEGQQRAAEIGTNPSSGMGGPSGFSSPPVNNLGLRNEMNRANNDYRPSRGRGILIEMRHEHALRCVHFPPGGNTIIVGGVNPASEGGIGGMIFSLKSWDFDITAISRKRMAQRGRGRGEALRNPHTFVSRALLYNDGGFDVSPCGKFLCACAEYWLPQGIDCATDLTPLDDYYDENGDDIETQNSPENSPEDGGLSSPSDMDIDDESRPLSIPNNSETDVSQSATIGTSNANNSSNTTTSSASGRVSFSNEISSSASNSQVLSTPPRSNRSASNAANPSSPSPPPASHNSDMNSQHALPQDPLTPPAQTNQSIPLSPPSPPGRRLIGGLTSNRYSGMSASSNSDGSGRSSSPPPPPNVSPSVRGASYVEGRFVPHVVTVSLEKNQLGKLLEAAPLDGAKASGVTCVKFSPSAEFCLLGYGVRENVTSRRQRQNGNSSDEDPDEEPCHPVTALYRIEGGMTHVSTMMSQDDDVNIARFHPHSGHGFVYGTKQGRVRILSPKPWNYLARDDENT